MDKQEKYPLISIITAVYNNERYIRNVAESVLNQDFKDIEYIIVDDGSTDKTPQIIDEIASKDARVKVIHQKNQWIFASYNNGVKAASGKYFYIINSDDLFQKNILIKVAEYAKQYNPDVIWTPILVHKCDENQNIIDYDYENLKNRVKENKFYSTKEEVRNAWIEFDKMSLSANQANLYKRELALNHPFRNDIYGADNLFNIQIADDIESAYVMSEPVYDFMNYQSEDMNVSVGKFYGYEHSMFNMFYIDNIRLYKKWNILTKDIQAYLARRRIRQLTNEMKKMNFKTCIMSLEKKLEKVTADVSDEVIKECVEVLNAQEEFECRVLSGIKNILINEKPDESNKYYFLYELLYSLLRYEKNEEDYQKIENAIYHPLNRAKIGLTLYKKISDRKYLF